ncbi:MAG TPA: hypothetical protein VFU45_09410 [Gemmatimonadales bacterium]|nr:hypothetical protein [Gemmatimonadales bacterium]
MIRLPYDGLAPAGERGLRLLVDASRVVPAAPSVAGAVVLEVVPGGGPDPMAGPEAFAVVPGIVRAPLGVLERVAAWAGATEEEGSPARDRFDRVPSGVNPFVAAGAERRPVLSELAAGFRRAVAAAAGDGPFRAVAPWPGGHRWAAVLSHDLDVVAGWPLFTALRVLELGRKGDVGRSLRVLGAAAVAGRDPITAGVADLLHIEAELGVRSTWFILCGDPTLRSWRRGDLTYRPESRRASGILARIRGAGHELGVHGSFDTIERPELLATQRARLAALDGTPPAGIRQHFLRMRPMETQRAMARAGFQYDSTFGFADRNGFRLGLADVVPLEGAADFDLLPFCWMDRALSKYQEIEDPAAWIDDGLALARMCRQVDGVWCGIWHPNLVPALGFPGGLAAYRALVSGIQASGDPWIAPAEAVVEWRRARRSVAIAGVDASGKVLATGTRSALGPLRLEDQHGNAREPVEAAR